MTSIRLNAVPGIPLIHAGDDLSNIIIAALTQAEMPLQDDDILVISSKIVSKAEGCIIDLRTVTPSAQAEQVAATTHKDPRIVELILQESDAISRQAPHVLVTQHRLGFVSANAGIDQSNVADDTHHILLLPKDPDASARQLREALFQATGARVGIVISDTHGRPFRLGNIGVAIGVAGIPALRDLRGEKDLYGRILQISLQAYGDLVASAAHLVCGEAGEGRPVVHLRGLQFTDDNSSATDLNRNPEQDLYR